MKHMARTGGKINNYQLTTHKGKNQHSKKTFQEVAFPFEKKLDFSPRVVHFFRF